MRILVALGLLATLTATAWGQISRGLVDVRIRGDVRCIQPLPDGSFVLGGYTAYFNGVADEQLFRVLPNGTRLPYPVTVGGPVLAMALSDQWLYLGGDFQVVNGVSCPFVARVDAVTGAVDPTWRPAPNGDLVDLVAVPGGVVLSGSFSRIHGLPRNHLALVSTLGGGLPVENWRCDTDNQVDRLLLHQGWLYAGGRFKSIGELNRSALARLTPGGGVVDGAWNPAPNSDVYDLAADGTHLYCAGSFTRIGLANTPLLARLPLNSGSADPAWAPHPDSLLARICLSGDSVYASGNFTSISGLQQKYLARIPKSGGLADATWRPPFDGALLAMVPDGLDGFWGGGRFDSGVGGGSGFAHFIKTQGTRAPVYPARVENRGAVKVIKADPSTAGWLVGGDFDTVNGLSRHGLFRLGADRRLDANWNAGLGGFYTDVAAMDVLTEAGEVMIGGQFEVPGVAGELLYNCLRVRLSNGQTVATFKPQPSGKVFAIEREGGFWLLGGEFDSLGNQPVNYIARIGLEGRADPSFGPNPNGSVHVIRQLNGETYLGGEFTGFTMGQSSLPLPYLARLVNTAPDLAWQPRPNQAVFALAIEGNNLYVGGRFDRMARVRRKNLAQLPLGGAGTPTLWNPSPDQEVNALRIDGANLYVGGSFFTLADRVWPKLARFQLPSLTLDTQFRTTGENGAVYAIEPQTAGGGILIGGSFTGWDDDATKRSLVAVVPGTGGSPAPASQPLIPDGTEETLADFFAVSGPGGIGTVNPLPTGEGPGLSWVENRGLPHGMVARVQWSEDLVTWHESGETRSGRTRLLNIRAEGQRRVARLSGDGSDPADAVVFLRVVVTPGENPPSKLLQ